MVEKSILDELQCSGRFPVLEEHSNNSNHGDVCRKGNEKNKRNFRCPKNCFKIKKKPFCRQKGRRKRKPCRTFSDKGELLY